MVLTVLAVLKGGEGDECVPVCGIGQVSDVEPGTGVVVGVAGGDFVEQLYIFSSDCVAAGQWRKEHHLVAVGGIVVGAANEASA